MSQPIHSLHVRTVRNKFRYALCLHKSITLDQRSYMAFDRAKSAVLRGVSIMSLVTDLKVNIKLFLKTLVAEQFASTAITDREPST